MPARAGFPGCWMGNASETFIMAQAAQDRSHLGGAPTAERPRARSFLSAALLLALACALLVLPSMPEASAISAGGIGLQDADTAGCHCHNVAPNANVTLNLMGMPERYVPDTAYTLTVTVAGGPPMFPGMLNAGGFMISCTNGTFQVPPGSDLVQTFNEGKAASHTLAGNDYRQWKLVWRSPKAGTGDALFHLSANSVNGDGVETGELDAYNMMRTYSIGAPQVTATGAGVSEWGVPLRAYWLGTIGFVAVLVLSWAAFYLIRGTSAHNVVHIGRRMRYRVEERTPPTSFGAAVVVAILTVVEAIAAVVLVQNLTSGRGGEGMAIDLAVVLALFAVILAVYRAAFVPKVVRIEPEEASKEEGA
jgi:hypothetical protein